MEHGPFKEDSVAALVSSRSARILVLNEHPFSAEEIEQLVLVAIPDSVVVSVASASQLRELAHTQDFDVVVTNCSWSANEIRHLVYELKNCDNQPSLITVSDNHDRQAVAELYNSGCHRCIQRDTRWQEELALSIRHLLRFRQVLEENINIRTKLTEANMLLSERNKRLDEFSATVAHDIRGPLGGITMKLQYLQEYVPEKFEGKVGEILNRAVASSTRLAEIVQAMYDFAKLGAKARTMTRVDLSEVVTEVLSDLEFDSALDIQIVLGQLPVIWGNKELIRRVFLNLISNAVKYNDKPQIQVTIGMEKTLTRSIGKFCDIIVEDNGPGIPPEDLAGVFSMFSRGSSSEGTEGSGIGLAVVQRIVELHMGHVCLSSTPGHGTKCVLSLPLEKIELVK